MNGRPAGSATQRPAAVLMKAGGMPAVTVGVLCAAGFLLSSGRAALSVLVGSLLAIVVLSAGPALLAMMRSISPPAAMLLAMIVYGVVVMVLAVVYLQLLELSWLKGGPVGAGIAAATVAWLVGMIRAVPRLRIPIFGTEETPARGPGDADSDGSPASPSGPAH